MPTAKNNKTGVRRATRPAFRKIRKTKDFSFFCFGINSDHNISLSGDMLALFRENPTRIEAIGFLVRKFFEATHSTFIKLRASTELVFNVISVFYTHGDIELLKDIVQYAHDQDMQIKFLMKNDTDFFQVAIYKEKKINSPVVIIRDSTAIYNGELKDMVSQFGGVDLSGLDFAGGVHAYFLSMKNYNKYTLEVFGVNLGYTVSGTAVKAWQKTLEDNDVIFNLKKETEDFCRTGYYGGYCYVGTINKTRDVSAYDLNSSYVFAMKQVGGCYREPAWTSEYCSYDIRPGFFKVDVIPPRGCVIPVLGFRDADGVTRWPKIPFTTVATNLEIDFALSIGYKITVVDGVVWEKSEPIFSKFVDLCEGVRSKNKGGVFEAVVKLFQTSVYGKVGARRERREVISFEQLEEIKKTAEESGEAAPVAIPLEWLKSDAGSSVYWLHTAKASQDEMISRPDISAFISAYARIRLLKYAYALGVSNVLYMDTDSLVIKSGVDCSCLPVSAAYGDFKKVAVYEEFRARAPKCYIGVEKGGKINAAVKGVPVNFIGEDVYRRILDTDDEMGINYNSLTTFLNTMKTGADMKRTEKTRTIQ